MIASTVTEVDLSAKGLGEAKSAGGLLKTEGIAVDMAFTSYLKRARGCKGNFHCYFLDLEVRKITIGKAAVNGGLSTSKLTRE